MTRWSHALALTATFVLLHAGTVLLAHDVLAHVVPGATCWIGDSGGEPAQLTQDVIVLSRHLLAHGTLWTVLGCLAAALDIAGMLALFRVKGVVAGAVAGTLVTLALLLGTLWLGLAVVLPFATMTLHCP